MENGDDGRCVRIRSFPDPCRGARMAVDQCFSPSSARRLLHTAAGPIRPGLKCEVPTRTLLLRLSSASSGVSLFLDQQSPSFAPTAFCHDTTLLADIETTANDSRDSCLPDY